MDREHIIFLSKAVRNICLLPIHFNFTSLFFNNRKEEVHEDRIHLWSKDQNIQPYL